MLGSAGPPQLNLKRRPTGAPRAEAGVSSSNLFSGWEHCGTPAGFVLRPRSPHWHISDARLGLRYRDRDRRGAPGKARPGPSHLLRRIDDSERVGKAHLRSRERLRLSHHESKRNISRRWATKTPGRGRTESHWAAAADDYPASRNHSRTLSIWDEEGRRGVYPLTRVAGKRPSISDDL